MPDVSVPTDDQETDDEQAAETPEVSETGSDQAPAPTMTPAAPPMPSPEDMPAGATVDVQGQGQPQPTLQDPRAMLSPTGALYQKAATAGLSPEDTKAYLADQDAKFAQDLRNGHIEPKTMQGLLFDGKDDWGKLGTLFGLMVAGAGSGLAHQQNSVLTMMQNQINNDLEAQKQSKTNAYNLLNLNQAHQQQQMQQALNASQIPLNEASAKWLGAQKNNLTQATTQIQANRLGLHAIMLQAGFKPDPNTGVMIPPTNLDPNVAKAIGIISQGVDQQNGNISDKAAGTTGLINAVNPPQAQGTAPGAQGNLGIDDQRLKSLIQVGSLPGGQFAGIPPAEAAQATQNADIVKNNRAALGQYVDSFNKLNKSMLAGHLDSNLRDTEIGSIIGPIMRASNIGSEGEARSLINGIMPSGDDVDPNIRREKLKKGIDAFAHNEAATSNLDRYPGVKKPFPMVNIDKKSKDPIFSYDGGKTWSKTQ